MHELAVMHGGKLRNARDAMRAVRVMRAVYA
jgi:hypothetical protein